MSRGGARKDTDEPERRCLATGETGPKGGLIRFVVGPGDIAVPDLAEKLPGRGMWVSADRAALDLAVKKKLFSRAAKRQVRPPEDLVRLVEDGLADRLVKLIALARKAGGAVAGYEKVKAWLETGEAVLLLQASDGSERGKTKLRPPGGPETLITVLSGTELGLAFGRENVVHGALAAGGLAHRVVEEASRLAGLRPRDEGNSALGKD
ncbi:RNA-binding protein [Mangrovicoccus algicola]|uniref:RNA-binding protein n=1 Tax=Mangrovicoccus algicola TaxID=2771008 RepID=A0A8J6YXT1_9RHOB|nr:RNA-binding protein [Mangrovicoccus algicola]MBE3637881.1 RNA-binding protein [Mangrovicoccus algicola]